MNYHHTSFSTGSISLKQLVSAARNPLESTVTTVSTQTRPRIYLEILKDELTRKNQDKTHFLNLYYLLRKESNGGKSVKIIRMKKHHPDPSHGLDTRQMLEQMLAENVKWGKFGSITSSALAEEQKFGQH